MLLLLAIVLCSVKSISCHARLMEPPSRSSMWRHGFENPKNYDDDGLYCGGMQTQWKLNGGKCGVCGDPWHFPVPRPNEMGGRYGNGIIVRSYKPGQAIKTEVDITANHKGYFEFRICPNKNPKKEVTQACLDQNKLTIVNSKNTRYYVEEHGRSKVPLSLKLPDGLTCKHCVLQWTYVAGNNWGKCKDGTFGLGCGAQETFKACADISISDKEINITRPTATTTTTKKPKPKPTPPTFKPNTWNRDKKKRPTVSNKDKNKRPANSNKNKTRRPVFRPFNTKTETFEEAIERIKKDPRLKWMVQSSY